MNPDAPDLVAAADQGARAQREVALVVFAHYREHVDAGFNPEQAFALTLQFAHALNVGTLGGGTDGI